MNTAPQFRCWAPLLTLAIILFSVPGGAQQSGGLVLPPHVEPEPVLTSDGPDPALRFAVGHGHHVGFCLGYLFISRERVKYEEVNPPSDRSHSIEIPRSDIVSIGQWKSPFGVGPQNWAVFKLRHGPQISFLHVWPRNIESGSGAREESLPYKDLVDAYNDFDEVVARIRERDARLHPAPPVITIAEPIGVRPSLILPIIGPSIRLRGAAEQRSGIASISVNGTKPSITASGIERTEFEVSDFHIQAGANPITIRVAANDKTEALLVFQLRRPELRILEPSSDSKTVAEKVKVHGEVNDFPDLDRVEVAGVRASTHNTANGTVDFVADNVPITVGPNLLKIAAVSSKGEEEDAAVIIQRSAPPEPTTLSAQEIEDALSHQIPKSRLLSLINKYGVDFALTKAVEQHLRALGADSDILLLIAQSRK